MTNIRVALKHNGEHLVDSTELTKCIAYNNLSIDEQKLQGLDNFIIAEQRANITVNLVNQNKLFNDKLIKLLTNDNYRLNDIMPTQMISCHHFDKETLISQTKDEVLFEAYFANNNSQTWENNQNKIVPQSKTMIDIFYTMINNGGAGDITSEIIQLNPGSETAYYYNYKKTYKQNKYTFNNGFLQLLSFFMRGLQIEYGLSKDTNYLSISNVFLNYLNDISFGLGTNFKNYLENQIVYSQTGTEYNAYFDFRYIFLPLATYIRRQNPTINYATICFAMLYNYMTNSGWADESGFINPNNEQKAAIILASLVKYNWYKDIKNEYFLNNCNIDTLKIMGSIYNPFYKVQEVIVRKNAKYINYGKLNIFFRWTDSGYSPNTLELLCLMPNMDNSRLPTFGKSKQQTIQTETDPMHFQDFIINDHDRYNNEGLFIPVSRFYGLKNTDFASIGSNIPRFYMPYYIDSVNYNEIAGTPSNNFACLTGYNEINWMYFDNLTCKEAYSPDTIFVDDVPVFDAEDSHFHDDFGLYIYKEHFNKFYTKEKSNLTDIVLEITNNDIPIYTGLIDFSTIRISKQSLSFTATDIIGLLIENLQKLDGIVNFSQFDIGDNYTADKRAGTTILNFINSIVQSPFPYRPTGFGNNEPIIDQTAYNILDNKVLNELSSSDSLIIAIQSTGKLLYCDGYGNIKLRDIDTYVPSDDDDDDEIDEFWNNILIIDDDNIIEYTNNNGINVESFDSEKIKTLAGHESILPIISKQYTLAKQTAKANMDVKIINHNDIKLLDKIYVNGKVWIVLSINYNLQGG